LKNLVENECKKLAKNKRYFKHHKPLYCCEISFQCLEIPPNDCDLVKSMPKRVSLLIEHKGADITKML